MPPVRRTSNGARWNWAASRSVTIVLDDVDIAANGYMLTFFGLFNTGQACVAQTRVLVPRSRHDEIVDAMVAAAQTMTVGIPTIRPPSSAR